MSVEKMMNRLRSFSQGKKEVKEENQTNSTIPSKEDIISTIDGFGNQIEGKVLKRIFRKWLSYCLLK